MSGVEQQLLTFAADLLDELERDHPGVAVDDFVIVASYDGDECSGVRIAASDERLWAIEGLLRAGIDTARSGEAVDEE